MVVALMLALLGAGLRCPVASAASILDAVWIQIGLCADSIDKRNLTPKDTYEGSAVVSLCSHAQKTSV